MKTTLSTALVAVAIIASVCAPVFAQTPTATPAAKTGKQPLRPKATTKGVGTKKIVNGTKTAGRKTEGTVGRGASSVKKSLSQNSRNLQNALSGKQKPKATPTPAPAVKP